MKIKDRDSVIQSVAHAAVTGSIQTLRSNGGALSSASRDELLARAAAGQYVELELDVLAYEQKTDQQNRNFVRFRDGAMMSLGRSGKGIPFIRDHNSHDLHSRAGTVTASSTEKRGEGDYVVRQTVKLTAPWAVDLVLRGLLDTVSIGWKPTGPVLCSACDTEVLERCWHFPGDRLSETDGKLTRAADGPIVCEWVYSSAELVECSAVSVPGVPSAQIEGIRAALALDHNGGMSPQESSEMQILPVLATKLSLAATAGEDEVLNAVSKLLGEKNTLASELAIADAERVKLAAIVAEHQKVEQKNNEDTFIRNALSTGRIAPHDELSWRDLYQSSVERATLRMSERSAGCSTPVGQPRLSAVPVPAEGNAAVTAADSVLAAAGVDPKAVMYFAKKFGAKTPALTIAKSLGISGGE